MDDPTKPISDEERRVAQAIDGLSAAFREEVGHLVQTLADSSRIDTRFKQKHSRYTMLATFVSLFSIAMSLYGVTSQYLKSQETSWKYQMAAELQRQIDDQMAKRDALNSAIVQIRSDRDVYQRYCNELIDPKNSAMEKELSKNLIKSVFNLINPVYAIKTAFDIKIFDESARFIKLIDFYDSELCSEKAVKDDDLKLLQRHLDQMMFGEILVSRQKREELLKHIQD